MFRTRFTRIIILAYYTPFIARFLYMHSVQLLIIFRYINFMATDFGWTFFIKLSSKEVLTAEFNSKVLILLSMILYQVSTLSRVIN